MKYIALTILAILSLSLTACETPDWATEQNAADAAAMGACSYACYKSTFGDRAPSEIGSE